MPRPKTITDAEILTVARSLFLQAGARASTRTLSKLVGISEAVIFQRFGTKEDLFFAAMVPPAAQLDKMFDVRAGSDLVSANLRSIGLQIVAYFREVMPVFLSLVSHPAFDLPTFLQRHTLPAMQIGNRLTAYLEAEATLGRIRTDIIAPTVAVLLSHLHNLALSETIGAHHPTDTERGIDEAIALLWQGISP